MSLLAGLVLGGMTLVAGLVGLAYARDGIRSVAATARVLTGPEAVPDGEGATFLTLSLADTPDAGPVTLGRVRDTFGYWLVRYWASGGTAYGIVGGLLMRVLFDPEDYRFDDDRRPGSAVDPGTVRARVDGRLRDVTFDDDAAPLQRLEANGTTVPFLVGVGASVAFGLGLVSPTVPVMLRLYPRFGWGVLGVVGLTAVGVLAGKRYHDTAAVGRWDAVTGLDDDAVPDALAAAGDTDIYELALIYLNMGAAKHMNSS